MKSTVLLACLVIMAMIFSFPARAQTAEETILLMVFGLNPNENSLLLTRQMPTANRWLVVTPVDPIKFLFARNPSDSTTTTGQVEISPARIGGDDASNKKACQYKVRMFNDRGVVRSVYDFDFSHVSEYKVSVDPFLPDINPVPVKRIIIAGDALVAASAINLDDGTITHARSGSWQYVLSADALAERLAQAYDYFEAQFCTSNRGPKVAK